MKESIKCGKELKHQQSEEKAEGSEEFLTF